MAFYIAVGSAASRTKYPENREASFTTKLHKDVILNGEYDVAVNSLNQYGSDVIVAKITELATPIVRSKRGTACSSVADTYPKMELATESVAMIEYAKELYVKATPPILLVKKYAGEYTLHVTLLNTLKKIRKSFEVLILRNTFMDFNSYQAIAFENTLVDDDITFRISFLRGHIIVRVIDKVEPVIAAVIAKPGKSTKAPPTTVTPAPPTKAPRALYYVNIEPETDLLPILTTTLITVPPNSNRVVTKIEKAALPDERVDLDFILKIHIDDMTKYTPNAIISNDQVLSDIEFTHVATLGLAITEVIKGGHMSNPKLKDLFEPLNSNRLIPKYAENTFVWKSSAVAACIRLPEVLRCEDGRRLDITLLDTEFNTSEAYTITVKNIAEVASYVSNSIKLDPPYTLAFALVGTRLTIQYSEHISISLPYVFHHYNIDCLKVDEQWPITIHYKQTEGVDTVDKSFKVARKETVKAQGESIKKEIHKETGDKTLEFELLTGPPISYNVDKKLSVDIPYTLAAKYKIPTLLKYRSEAEKTKKTSVWITCDLVDEMMVGEGAVKLLTPSPLEISNQEIVRKQYVPAAVSRFSEITLQCYTDIESMTPHAGSSNLMVVLHFTPRYKRIRSYTDNDTIESKRFMYG